LDFDWDSGKAAANERKHGISFEVAVEVFADENRVDFDVTHEADGEVIVGHLDDRLVTLVYTVRQGRIRLISARPPNEQEVRRYGYRYLYP